VQCTAAPVLLGPGDVVAVEEPGYPVARRAFQAQRCRAAGVPIDGEGIVVERIPPGCRGVQVTPSHQYDGVWNGQRILPAGWAREATTRHGAARVPSVPRCFVQRRTASSRPPGRFANPWSRPDCGCPITSTAADGVDMRRITVLAGTLLVLGCQGEQLDVDADRADLLTSIFDGRSGGWVDLTHAFSPNTVFWPTDTLGFRLEELSYGRTDGGWFYASYRYSAAEHGGTHLDAPIHFAEGRHTTDEIPLRSLIGPAVVIDVSARAHSDYLVSVEDLTGWEAEHGRIADGAIVLVRTGWGARYGDRAAYLGTDRTGPAAVAELHFPGLGAEAAQWLVENRSVGAVGIDTPSIDYGQSTDFRAHVILYEENIPGFENVANLDALPPTGSYVVALPMKIEGGSGGPLRIVAYVP
jgi:kynurenine formamidase